MQSHRHCKNSFRVLGSRLHQGPLVQLPRALRLRKKARARPDSAWPTASSACIKSGGKGKAPAAAQASGKPDEGRGQSGKARVRANHRPNPLVVGAPSTAGKLKGAPSCLMLLMGIADAFDKLR